MTFAKSDADTYERVYEKFEVSKCIDWVEELQGSNNEDICKLSFEVIKDNSPEGIVASEDLQ